MPVYLSQTSLSFGLTSNEASRALGQTEPLIESHPHTLEVNRTGLMSYLKGQWFEGGFRREQPQVYGAAERKAAIMCSGWPRTAEV